MYKLTDSQIQGFINTAAESLFTYCKKHNIHSVVTGVSGGLDSAVTLALAAEAQKIAQKNDYVFHNVGLLLPCHSDPEHTQRGEECIDAFQAKKIIIDLSSIFDQITDTVLPNVSKQLGDIFDKEPDTQSRMAVAQGNIRCRLRMMLGTYHVAKMLNGLVLSTDNYSEYLMGFWTICGDVGDYGMIQKVFKGLELYDIARKLGVPRSVIEAMPDDGLGIQSGGDEAQLGADYKTVDTVMITLMQNGFDPDNPSQDDSALPEVTGVDKKIVRSLWNRAKSMSYKRKGTVIIEREALGLPSVDEIDEKK